MQTIRVLSFIKKKKESDCSQKFEILHSGYWVCTLSDRKLWGTERRKINSTSDTTPGAEDIQITDTGRINITKTDAARPSSPVSFSNLLDAARLSSHVSFSKLLDHTSVLSTQLALRRSCLRSCQPSKPAPKLRHHAMKLCGITWMHPFLLSLGTRRRWLVNCG